MTRAVPLSRFVVSPDQWERVLVHHAWGDVDMYFADLFGPRQEDETFVVSYNGDLARSAREKLPPVRRRALKRKVAEARQTSRRAVVTVPSSCFM